MRGYDLVITITSSFYGFNNLKNLIYELREEKKRDRSLNHNLSIDVIKSLNWIRIILVEMAPRSVILINLNDMGQLESINGLIKTYSTKLVR